MKNIKFFFITFLFCQNIFGQIDHNKAHRRYWYYRTRMVNDFIKIGKQQGDCIVFAQRNKDRTTESKIGPDQIDITNQYIMALALEYKILSRGSQDCSETIYELYHLMWALNRLDLEAEQYWDAGSHSEISGYNGPLNGYMLREDMPLSYLGDNDNLKHFNYELNLDPNAVNPNSFCGLPYSSSLTSDNKFSGYFHSSQPKGDLSLPHDKYHSMLVALMFVVKYIPDGVSYYENGNLQHFQDGESELKTEAKKMAEHIYHYVSNSNYVLHYKNSNESNVGDLDAGKAAWGFSWPLSRMACHVKNGFPFTENVNYCYGQGVMDAFASSVGLAEYNGMALTTTLPPITITNIPFVSKDIYISPEDYSVFKAWDQAGTNTSAPGLPIWISMNNNSTVNSVEWAELMRKVLHQDGLLGKQLSVFAKPIEVASCNGPYNFRNCDYPDWEWSSQDRLEHPYYRGHGCNNLDAVFQGYYPGVDYMLLHNLYYEYMNQLILDNANTSSSSQSGGNGINGFFATIGNIISNAVQTIVTNVSNFINTTLPSVICNSSLAGTGIVNCNSTANYNVMVPYFGYNLMDNYDNSIWPRKLSMMSGPMIGNAGGHAIMLGVNSTPAKVSVFQNLISNATINVLSPVCGNCINTSALQETSNVEYRAGKEITLTTGFTANAGCNFHAYIARYLCYNSTDPMNMRIANDSTFIDSLDYLKDNFMQIPTHIVESPKSDSDLLPFINDSTGQNSRKGMSDLNYVQQKLLDENRMSFNRFVVLPNPNNGQFKIYVNRYNDEESISVSIYDMKGVEIKRYENIFEILEINLTEFGKGIYLVKMFSSLMKEQELKKIIVQ